MMRVLRFNITCKKCGKKGFVEFNFTGMIRILVLLVFGSSQRVEV